MDTMNTKCSRILVLSNMYPSKKYPHYGVFVRNCVNILEEASYQVSVTVLKKKDTKIGKVFGYLFFYIEGILKIIFGRYDVVYAHYASHTSLSVCIGKKINKRIKVVTNVHGNDIVAETDRDSKYLKMSKKLLDISDLIICPSMYFAEIIKSDFKIEDKKIKIYPSGGVDTELFKKCDKTKARGILGLELNKKYIGYISRIEEKKGWDILLKAYHLFLRNHNDYYLIIVGDGSQINEYNKIVDSLDLKKRIIKYKLVDQKTMSLIFNAIDCFVFPTYRKSESLGLVGLEAMACETITILPDKYGPTSYEKDKENSIVFKSGDYESLLDALEYMDRTNCDAIAHKARQTALAYSKESTNCTLLDVFSKL